MTPSAPPGTAVADAVSETWPRVPLAEICRINAPIVDPRSNEFRDLPHVSGEDIESGTGRLLALHTAAEDGMTSGKYLFDAGVVLYSKLRPYLRKVTVADFHGLCSADMYPLVFDRSRVCLDFAKFGLLSEDFTAYAVEASARARMPKLNREQLLAYEFPLPLLEAQERIAAELTAALAAVDKARRAAQERLAAAEALPAAYLREVFEGAEANEWPSAELASACRVITDGTHLPPPFTESGVPFLFVRNIVSGVIDFKVEKYISTDTYAELTRRHRAERGDVLFSAVGSFGVAVVVETDQPFAFQRHIAHIKTDCSRLDPHFLAFFLNSPLGRAQSDAVAMGGAQRTVTLADFRRFRVPLPALAVQQDVANHLRERLAGATALLRMVDNAAIEALPAALLREAFNGSD